MIADNSCVLTHHTCTWCMDGRAMVKWFEEDRNEQEKTSCVIPSAAAASEMPRKGMSILQVHSTVCFGWYSTCSMSYLKSSPIHFTWEWWFSIISMALDWDDRSSKGRRQTQSGIIFSNYRCLTSKTCRSQSEALDFREWECICLLNSSVILVYRISYFIAITHPYLRVLAFHASCSTLNTSVHTTRRHTPHIPALFLCWLWKSPGLWHFVTVKKWMLFW